MNLQSFAMLLPCGVGIFSGVEFVCCPKPVAPTTERVPIIDNHLDSHPAAVEDNTDKDSSSEDDDDDDDYYDDDYDEDDDDDDDDDL